MESPVDRGQVDDGADQTCNDITLRDLSARFERPA